MASRSDIEAGKAHILLSLKNTMTKGLKAAQAELQSFGTSAMKIGAGITAAGASIVTPMVAAVAKFAEMGKELSLASARTGESAASLGELKYAAERTGVEFESVTEAFKKMHEQGITSSFDEIAEELAAIQDRAERTRRTIALWGDEGTKLLPLVENLAAMRKEARDLGIAPTNEEVSLAAKMASIWATVHAQLEAIVFQIGAALAPTLIPAAETATRILATIIKWVRENGALVRTVFMIGAGLVAAGATITAIGAAVFGLGSAFGALASIIGGVSAVLGAILSPIGLIAIGITAATVAFFKFTEAGRNAAASIMGFFAPLFEMLKTGFGGITDALIAGDLALAAQIATTTLKAIFMDAVAQIANNLTSVLGDTLGSIATDLIAGDFAGAWDTVVAGIASVWDSLMAGIFEAMNNLVQKVTGLWNGMIAGLQQSVQVIGNLLPDSAQGLVNGLKSGIGGIGAVGSGVGALGGSVTSSIASSARSQADASKSAFDRRIAGGGDAARAEADALRKELDELRKRAAEARAAATAETPELPGAGDVGAMAKQTFSTFSATAALLQGGGASAAERTAKNTELSVKQQAEIAAQLGKMTHLLGTS